MLDTASTVLGSSPAAIYLTSVLAALARAERRGKKPKRLTEARHATWERFKGRMGAADFVDLLLEEAAVNQPEPFDAAAVLDIEHPTEAVAEDSLAAYVAQLVEELEEDPGRDQMDAQAAALGFKARPAFSDLPKIDTHHRVLEVPGSGGRLTAFLVQSRPTLSFKDGFFISCASWQERLLAGLGAVDLDVIGRPRIALDPDLALARAADLSFTHVIGLRPDKGGSFDEHQIHGYFPKADIKLV